LFFSSFILDRLFSLARFCTSALCLAAMSPSLSSAVPSYQGPTPPHSTCMTFLRAVHFVIFALYCIFLCA
jgi:hypothetical protein